jgi:hypothetical protein
MAESKEYHKRKDRYLTISVSGHAKKNRVTGCPAAACEEKNVFES